MAAPMFAFEEEHRAEGLAVRAAEITADPGHPSAGSLPLYQAAARAAFEASAAHTDQPHRS
ncbi:hypothetical protein GCM10010387_43870 [Streptomyces inusitatus]|uniref:Uncharacterized protein n=1 Tax=Streptomyces inusitatus TaxID=68221 RepID=A0A918QG44_9ACTN|nr:hypothetical protein [Streptomyces inusitatus]GGZ44769.1 hypothetical protein GCM10010387_43870 [Streptomyces inusitatus]